MKLDDISKEVSAGKYRVEVKKEVYYEQSRTVNIEKGNNKTESFTLEQKTGKLQFTIEPMESKVTLKQGNSTMQSWNGSKYLSSLAIGNYTISATLNGYTNQTQQVKINLDETTKVNIELEKGKDLILPATSKHFEDGSGVEGDMVFLQGATYQMGSKNGKKKRKRECTFSLSIFRLE